MVVDHWNGYGSTPPDNKLWFNSGQRVSFLLFVLLCIVGTTLSLGLRTVPMQNCILLTLRISLRTSRARMAFEECVSQVGQEPGILLRGCLSPSLTLSLRAFVDMRREKRRLHFVSSLTRLS